MKKKFRWMEMGIVVKIHVPIQLWGLGRHLGNSKKEIMALSRSLIVGQSASMATEATRLVDEAGEAIKANRESLRAALRGLGVASDISEASGPTWAQHPPPARNGGPTGRRTMGTCETSWCAAA
jgi:hypothetical protein